MFEELTGRLIKKYVLGELQMKLSPDILGKLTNGGRDIVFDKVNEPPPVQFTVRLMFPPVHDAGVICTFRPCVGPLQLLGSDQTY